MKTRRPVVAAIVVVIGILAVIAIAAGDGHDDQHGDSNERAASVAPAEDVAADAAPTEHAPVAHARTTTSKSEKPVAVALAPCAVFGSADPYLVVCGPASVETGDRVAFDLVARGHIRDDCGSPAVDWGDSTGNILCTVTCDAYPADEHSFERKLQHTYADPGVYTVRFALQGCGPDQHPQAELTMELQVR